MKPQECVKCKISVKDPMYWDTHQAMNDGKIWCTNKGDKK